MNTRKIIRLSGYDYSSEGAYFITICVKDRMCLLGEIINDEMILSELGKVAHKNLLEIKNYYKDLVFLDEFIIMPNHIHLIIIINVEVIHELPLQKIELNYPIKRRKMLLPKIIGKYKMNTAKEINLLINASGKSFWQRNYYEHIIRNENSLNAIRKYIIENPLNWYEDRENPFI